VLFVLGLVISSECTPLGSRILHRALGVDFLNMGGVVLGLLDALHHNPITCSASGSRWCLLPAAIFSSVVFALAAALLPESPVFLAGAGRYEEAQEELDRMRQANGAAAGSGLLLVPAGCSTGRVWTLRERLQALVAGRRWYVMLLMSGTLMVVKKGIADAESVGPPVFFSEEYLGDWYRMLSSILKIMCETFAFLNAAYFTRNVALGNSMLIFSLFTFVFVVFNPLRSGGGNFLVESLSQVAGAGLVYGCRLVLTVGYQICIEFWPTMSAVTSGSVVIFMGYTKLWLFVWPSIKSLWPRQMAEMLDVVQLMLLVPLAYGATELQRPAEGPDSEKMGGVAEKYGTFKMNA